MDIRKLQRAIVDGLEDVKAHNIVVLNTEHLSPLFERVIIASGTSNRQTKALAASVRDAVKGSGLPVPRTEGEENGEWIIVDCGAAVAHIMQPAIRQYYHLEELWGSKPVKMKIDSERHALPKAAARKSTTTKPPAKTAAAPQASAKKPATPTKAVVKQKPMPAKKAISRTVGVKSGAPRKATTKAPARKAAPAKRPTAKKMPARKASPRA
jgi:ribosome-associated protein